mgnify:CR=1 FL=1
MAMSYLEALKEAGLEISEETALKLASLESNEASKAKLVAALEALAKAAIDAFSAQGLAIPPIVQLVRQEDGTAKAMVPARKTSGNGSNRFGGGGGTKVRGPFRDSTTGQVYQTWHDVAIAVLAHVCTEGATPGTSYCGYWTKHLTDLRDSGRFIPAG